jgi:GT2 family glycosyltransferase
MISVVICSIDAGKFAAVSRNLADRLGGSAFELIGIHDARSLCEGYNRGIDRSRGDVLVFCHDDIEIVTPGAGALIRRHLETHDVVGCAGTDRLIDSNWLHAGDPFVHGMVAYPAEDAWPADRFDLIVWGGFERRVVPGIQGLDGFFLAANRRVVEAVRFDERTFDGFHVYDTDFTFAAHLAGFRIAVCKDILIAHRSGGDYETDYPVYGARFMAKHRGRLPAGTHNTRKTAVARGLDRAQMLRLCATAIGGG